MRVNMDTRTQVILFHGLSLAKKHFKPKTIEVMVRVELEIINSSNFIGHQKNSKNYTKHCTIYKKAWPIIGLMQAHEI